MRKFTPMVLAGQTVVGDTFRGMRAYGHEIALGATLWLRRSDPDVPYEEVEYTVTDNENSPFVPDKGLPMFSRSMVAIVNASFSVPDAPSTVGQVPDSCEGEEPSNTK